MLNPPVANWLRYLRDIGYRELLVPDPPPGQGLPENLGDLEVAFDECTQCRLSLGRNRVVFGAGVSGAELMVVGEGPGAEEDRQGAPFVGAAGELLTKILAAIDLSRDDVYIANVVKCRPPGNRNPHPDEVETCLPILEQQIRLVQPRVLVALGRVAANALLATESSLRDLRGRWHSRSGIPLRVTYHPAALLRNTRYKRPTWEDMKAVRARLAELREASD